MNQNHPSEAQSIQPNVLVVSDNPSFRHEAMYSAITATLEQGKRVLYVSANPQESHRKWRSTFKSHRALYASDDAPVAFNKPFLSVGKASLAFVSPEYLHHELSLPVSLLRSSAFLRDIELLVMDLVLDEANVLSVNKLAQGMVEMALVRLCLDPLDGLTRRSVVLLASCENHTEVAQWLHAEAICCTETVPSSYHFQTALANQEVFDTTLMAFISSMRLTSLDQCQALLAQTFPTSLNEPLPLVENLDRLYRAGLLTQVGQPDRCKRYQVTNTGRAMVMADLTAADVLHLQRLLKTPSLSWYDMVLIAATAPDYISQPGFYFTGPSALAESFRGLRSSLMQQSQDSLAAKLQVTEKNLLFNVKTALVGALAARGTADNTIIEHLTLNGLVSVNEICSSLRRRIYAMFLMTYNPAEPFTHYPLRIQVLMHLLHGVSVHHIGLASLPGIEKWVIVTLVRHNIHTLTALKAAVPEQTEVGLAPGLFRILQKQARVLLPDGREESEYLASFTANLPIVTDASPIIQTILTGTQN